MNRSQNRSHRLSKDAPGAGTQMAIVLMGIVLVAGVGHAADDVQYNRDIRRILSDNCLTCHGPDAKQREGGFRLDQRDSVLAEAESGERPIVPGDVSASELYLRMVSEDDDERMPPPDSNKTVTPEEVELIRRWIEQGAAYQSHWSFVPLAKVTPPPASAQRVVNDIDRFVLARLERDGFQPSPQADRRTLIRRVTLDLTGLPPTPDEVDAFVNDQKPTDVAYERVVDRLLKSPRYGEHMAYAWLDAARYADSDGYESDPLRNMWPWRDWVVWALNENMPYDQFIIEQLAGDLLPGATMRQRLATGFNRNHRLNNEGGILPEEWLVEYVADRAETTATVFMGLGWGCGRCHEHKYDPETQEDYYRLFAFFHNLPEKGSARGDSNAEPMLSVPRLSDIEKFEVDHAALQKVQQKLNQIAATDDFSSQFQQWLAQLNEEQLTKLPKELAKLPVAKWNEKQRSQARRHFLETSYEAGSALQEQISSLQRKQSQMLKTGSKVMVMADMAQPRQTHILERGAYNRPGKPVTAGTPSWLPPMDESWPKNRLGLARWLVDQRHPLTARVAANRFWAHHFGVGLVKMQDDFGTQGELPSHPELLDYLALHFMESGWDVKGLHKLIVLSSTYRQTSDVAVSLRTTKRGYEFDPENRLLARGPRLRLPAAVIRDQALAVSGLLVEQRGGPPVKPYQVDGLWREIIKGGPTYKPDTGDKLRRRSLYTLWRRAVKPPLMMLLDANERDTCKVSQQRTNTPLQALLLLNDVTFVEAARGLAERLIREGGDNTADRIAYGMMQTTGRRPTDEESLILEGELESYRATYESAPDAAKALIAVGETKPDAELPAAELAAYTALARLLLNLDETITSE
ncbi:MAG: PSD1 and planctomycete cytochrome C domain-containing protein [Pirellulaceae bacterium]|nr:PSD1 and planctomycete cytochrome C domain-containing protein [Pirellulaceae bacterium]